ncbi:hypothetical protein EVA_12789 [gut metagenome]|uniref:Uncharacterized protein n=1 Tax=gut metagenome TaxID=749906 RepID=J9FVV1_9ZZZZ
MLLAKLRILHTGSIQNLLHLLLRSLGHKSYISRSQQSLLQLLRSIKGNQLTLCNNQYFFTDSLHFRQDMRT